MRFTMTITRPTFLLLLYVISSSGVIYAARILEGPSSAAIELGNHVKLSCRVAEQGSDPIRWFRLDTNTIISTDGKVLKRSLRKRLRIVGDKTMGEYNLYFRQLTHDDNGTYACGVLSTVDERPIMSAPAHLAVIQRPLCSITTLKPPAPGVVVTLSCESQNQGLDVRLSWHSAAQPDQVLYGTSDVNQTANTRNLHLNVTLKPTDFGESFICKETLPDPAFTRGCSVTPLDTNLPVILFPKQMQTVQGQNATFTCIIASKNTLTYEWYINGYRDYNARKDKYVFSPVLVAHNNTRVECRTRDEVTEMVGNASSILYVYPTSIPVSTAAVHIGLQEDYSLDPIDPMVLEEYFKSTTLQPVKNVPFSVSPTDTPSSRSTEPARTTLTTTPTTPSTPAQATATSIMSFGGVFNSEQPSNVAYRPPDEKQIPGPTGVNRWSNMMVPVLAVGSVIALLLVCVIVVLLLFLVRQNRVAHGSTGGKEGSSRNDLPMEEVRHPGSDAMHANRTMNSESTEVDGDEEEAMGPKYFTLEPGKRKGRRLERSCSHMIVSDSSSEYNVLCRNASLRKPAGVKMNDYVRPDSQISMCEADMSTATAYAVTDVTLGGGTSSLRRSRSCLRPLPAAPIEAMLNRSHYSIPREVYRKPSTTTESSADSVTVPLRSGGPTDTLPGAYRRSHVATAFVPAGDEYAEIDSPPRAASPVSSDASRPNSPDTVQEQNAQTMKELAVSLASSYESGYDAASSDDVMDCESTSPYATIDVYKQNEEGMEQSPLPDRVAAVAGATSLQGTVEGSKSIPVYAKVKRTRSTQVEDKNIDDHNDSNHEVPC